MQILTRDVNVAFKWLCYKKYVDFVRPDIGCGRITVYDGIKYRIEYFKADSYRQFTRNPMLLGHKRVIDFMKDNDCQFIVDNSIALDSVLEPPDDYVIKPMNVAFKWKSIKEPITAKDVIKGRNGNSIVVLIAQKSDLVIADPEVVDMKNHINNNTDILIRNVGMDTIGCYIPNKASSEEVEKYVKELNQKFSAYIEEFYNTNCPDESMKNGNCWIYYPSEAIIGWMMTHEYDKAINEAFHSCNNLSDIYFDHFSYVQSTAFCGSWKVYNN